MSKLILEIEDDEISLDKLKKLRKHATVAVFVIDGTIINYPIKRVIGTCQLCEHSEFCANGEDSEDYCETFKIKGEK